jgi:hypothetical protein
MSRLYIIGGAILLALALSAAILTGAYRAGAAGERAKWEARDAAQLRKQAEINRIVADVAEQRASEREARAEAREQEVTRYAQTLQDRGNSCALGDSDVDRLRDILR